MTTDDDRPTAVLESPAAEVPAVPQEAWEPRSDRPQDPTAPADGLPPRGWGSHEDRRTMRWALVGFALLAAYAVVFILLGGRTWT